MTNEEMKIVRKWMRMLYEVVEETTAEGSICPEGTMYAALMASMTLDQFNALIAAGKEAGFLKPGPYAHTLDVDRVKATQLGVMTW